jgi:hypothetical protein
VTSLHWYLSCRSGGTFPQPDRQRSIHQRQQGDFLPRHERPGGNGARADSGAYPSRFSRSERAGEYRRTSPGNDS